MSPIAIIILIAIAVIVLAVAASLYLRSQRTKELRSRFGPEYSHTVKETGDRGKAEVQLRQREKRVEKFNIRPLPRGDRTRYLVSWQGVQAEFVDDPPTAVTHADELVGKVMEARGYPVSDFEQRSADLSVDHPTLVQNYRAGHEIALRHERGEVGTEELRQAMIHYRTLFEELVAEAQSVPENVAH